MKIPKPPQVGHGALTIARTTYPVAYALHYVDGLRRQRAAKGGLTGDPDVMRQAFREGRARLSLDTGHALDVSIIAHAEGSPTAYFETAVSDR